MIYYCESCEAHKNFNPRNVLELPNETPPAEYTFAACEKCDSPAVFIRENIGLGFDEDDYYRLYPAHERFISFRLPRVVRTSYEEAVRCEASKCWIASVTMVGRTLEAVTKQYAPGARSMFAGLQKMFEDGVISQEIHEWANALRTVRNIGAHAVDEEVTRQDASDALDFLQAILETLYFMRPKFNAMKARREQPLAGSSVVN
ncbi:DUF4145 domain-containing protein [Stenotrophomonas maltophilia]|uniref:DUF4145 domain-containing protein n=1 Tax=Stenotrophomonas maltophilia TaxID=40324 RepID=UPI0013DA2D4D|nr:DUF4145 domain-containing protein [Stenotrophomonas maltophilia]